MVVVGCGAVGLVVVGWLLLFVSGREFLGGCLGPFTGDFWRSEAALGANSGSSLGALDRSWPDLRPSWAVSVRSRRLLGRSRLPKASFHATLIFS